MRSLYEKLIDRIQRWSGLALWELRMQGWGRHTTSRIAGFVIVVVCVFCMLWALTLWRMRAGCVEYRVEQWVSSAAMQTPISEGSFALSRSGFAFTLLKFCALVIGIAARIFIPGVSGNTVAADRRTGRLAELRSTLYSSGDIVSAKTVAAAANYLGAFTLILIAMVPILVVSDTSTVQTLLIYLELAGSVLLIAALSVMCSVIVSYGNYGRAIAYMICWLPFPFFWTVALAVVGFLPHDFGIRLPENFIIPHDWNIQTVIYFQIGFSALMIVMSNLIAVWRIFPKDRARKRRTR